MRLMAAVLAGRVAAFQQHQDAIAMGDEVPLQLDEFDLQRVRFGLVFVMRSVVLDVLPDWHRLFAIERCARRLCL